MRTGITASTYFGIDGAQEGFQRMKAHGYDCCDYSNLCNTDNPLFALSDAEFENHMREDGAAARSAGIEIYQSHGPWRWPPRDFEAADREERFEKMSKALHGTKLLGCKRMVLHPVMPFGCDSNPEPERFMDINSEFFTRLCAVARQEDVIICLENMPMPALPLATPSQITDFVRRMNSQYLRVCLDTGHALITGDSPADSVKSIGKEYLACLHVHDNDGRHDQHLIPFTGVCDWHAFADALGVTGFDGPVSIESNLHLDKVPEPLRDVFRRQLSACASYISDEANCASC